MTTTITPQPTTAALGAEARDAGERHAALQRELATTDDKITDAAKRRDASSVVWLEQRKRDLPSEIAAAKAAYDQARLVFGSARERERRAELARKLEQMHERRIMQERAIALAVTSLVERCRDWGVTVRRLSELEGQLRGRPAAETIDAIRAPTLQFLDHAFQRLLDLLWVEHRPATVNLDGPAGQAERIVHRALFGND